MKKLLETKSRFRIALLAVTLLAVTAGCMGVLGGTQTIDYVPGSADGVVHVDADVTTDDDMRTILDTLAATSGAAESTEDGTESAITEFEDETGLDASAVNEVLYFTQPIDDQQYGTDDAVIVDTGWSEEELVESVEDVDGTTYEQVDDAPGTVYAPSDDQRYSPTWIGVLGDNMYVIGDETAVMDSAAVAHDDAPAADGALRNGYKKGGLVTFAYVSVEEEVPTDPSAVNGEVDLSALESVSAVSGSIDTSSGNIELTTDLQAGSESDATDVVDVVDGGLALVRSSYIEDQATTDELREVEVTQDGSTATVSYSGDVDQVNDILQNFY